MLNKWKYKLIAKSEYFQLCLRCFCLMDKVISLNSLIRYFLTPAFSPQLHMMDAVAKPFSPLSLKIELNQCCNPDKNNKNSNRKNSHSCTAAGHCFGYVWASQATLASLGVFLVFLLKLRYCFGFLNFLPLNIWSSKYDATQQVSQVPVQFHEWIDWFVCPIQEGSSSMNCSQGPKTTKNPSVYFDLWGEEGQQGFLQPASRMNSTHSRQIISIFS